MNFEIYLQSNKARECFEYLESEKFAPSYNRDLCYFRREKNEFFFFFFFATWCDGWKLSFLRSLRFNHRVITQLDCVLESNRREKRWLHGALRCHEVCFDQRDWNRREARRKICLSLRLNTDCWVSFSFRTVERSICLSATDKSTPSRSLIRFFSEVN